MSKIYCKSCDKKRNWKFFNILISASLVLVSNLSAVCTDLGDGHIYCDETVNSNIYNNASNGVSNSSVLDINTAGGNAYGVYSNNNGSWNFNELNIATSEAGSHAIYAQNGANISVGNNADISTNNTGSYGVYAMSNSNVNIGDNANIVTNGPNVPPPDSLTQSISDAVRAGGSNITIGDNANILSTGVGSYAVRTTNNGVSHIVIGDNATIATTGGNPYCGNCGQTMTGWYSYGVVTEGSGSSVTIGDNAHISTQGALAYALQTSSRNTAIYVGDNAVISTSGDRNAYAVYTQSGGEIVIGNNAVITTAGDFVYLANASAGAGLPHAISVTGTSGGADWDAIFTIGDNAAISTYGYDASGISASSYANVTIGDNAHITTYGEGRYTGASSSNEGGFGIKIRGSWANLTVGDNAVITTYGNQSLGVQVRELSKGIFGDNLTIITHGNNATALETYDRSNVTAGGGALITTLGNNSHAVHTLAYTTAGNVTTNIGKNSIILTEGAGSHALFAEGKFSVIDIDDNALVSTKGSGSHALFSQNGADIHVNDDAVILTTGNASHGLLASSSNVTAGDNVVIGTAGADSYAIYAQNNATVNVGNNADISTNNTNSHAINAESYSNVNIGDNAVIATYGPNLYPPNNKSVAETNKSMSYGVRAQYSNVTIGDNANILTTGLGSYGVITYENALLVIGDNVTIATTGGNPYCGMCEGAPGSRTGEGWASTAVAASGTNAVGSTIIIGDNANLSTQGWASTVSLNRNSTSIYIGDNAIITANGDRNSNAISMTNGGNLTIGDNAVITTTGETVYYDGTGNNFNGLPHAITGGTGSIFLLGDNAEITTYGYLASAVQFSDSLVVIGDNARITTYGEGKNTSPNEGAYGIKIRNGYAAWGPDKIIVGDNAVITTHGSQAIGVQIREKSTGIFGDNLTIITHGNNAVALETYDVSNVTVGNNALIATLGNASHALHTLAYTTAGETNTIVGSGSVISAEGEGSHAVFVEGRSAAANASVILNTNTNISASGDNSYAIYSTNINALVSTNASAKLNIFGDITASNESVVDLDLSDGSIVYGNTNSETGVINLAFDGNNSLWILSGNSSLTNLSLLNQAAVDLTQSSEFLTLRTDNLFGNGIFNMKLDANRSLNDKIVIGNSSHGDNIIIFDDRTSGGYITSGLSLSIVENINPTGDYQANFTGQAELGSYIYSLTWDNNTNIYYIGDTSPDGGNNSGGVTPTPPRTSSANSSIGFAAINYIANHINTQNILKRMGELRDNSKNAGNMWARTYIGKAGSFDHDMQIDTLGYYGLQIGVDKMTDLKEGRVYTGLSAGYLLTDTDYEKGDSEGKLYDLGIYAMYLNDSNFYLDAVMKYAKNKNSFNTVTINNMSVSGDGDSNAFSLSIEAGKRYALENNFYIEPQAELAYTKQGELNIKSSNSLKTDIESYNSYIARGSIIAGYKLKESVNIYAKTGYVRELDGKTSYMFNQDPNTKKESYTPNKNTFDNAIGITLNGISHNLYLEGIYQKGDEFNNMGVNVGYRYGF
ncbi:MAG: autotransporter outer membrane beta-barrel domain-containing protein [Campylobacteraceae bacterium]|jgi:outer membrane autotransporter protein|nr:autotransporter outer membrane beta-barrel domain-containing protein [Campylobacteraceae bacterium]